MNSAVGERHPAELAQLPKLMAGMLNFPVRHETQHDYLVPHLSWQAWITLKQLALLTHASHCFGHFYLLHSVGSTSVIWLSILNAEISPRTERIMIGVFICLVRRYMILI